MIWGRSSLKGRSGGEENKIRAAQAEITVFGTLVMAYNVRVV